MNDIELNDCLDLFSNMDLSYGLKELLWKKITNVSTVLINNLIVNYLIIVL